MARAKQGGPASKKARRLKEKAVTQTALRRNRNAKPVVVSDTEKPQPPMDTEIVLVDLQDEDGDMDDVVVVSENEDDVVSAEENGASELELAQVAEPIAGSNPRKRRYSEAENEVAGNNDFIGFGFTSSEDEADPNGAENDGHNSDDGYLSDDGSGASYVQALSTSAYPWVKGQDHSKQKEIADWLTLEIKDFVNYISPSKEEITTRNDIINNLKANISHFWPSTQAHVFGSSATDLYLPGSDIDMVVISTTGDYEERSRLYQLSSYLRKNGLAKNLQVIANAKVPIIKFVDPTHNVHVDISFERSNGLDAARRIRKWLSLTPGLRELVLIIKQFLRSRWLNDVHVGGLGGYSTIIMVYHFLKLHPRLSTGNVSAMENLGTLLIEFFELYGLNFSYDRLLFAIDPVNDTPKYMLKSACPQHRSFKGLFAIVIQDPSDPQNNITRSSYNLNGIKKAFVGAYHLLVGKCFELHAASFKERVGALILGDIIKFNGKDRDFNDDRDKVINDALIDHGYEDSESDGADGNDKYYFSDMTEESADDGAPFFDASSKHKSDAASKPSSKAASRASSKAPSKASSKAPSKALSPAPQLTSKPRADGKKVEDFMSLGQNSDAEENDGGAQKPQKSQSLLEKDTKREFWKLKGLHPANQPI
ncbi:hypothetical protein PUMCH_001714 [Australozyma saopauloensis]|uniref:polynucleotide adenylyltransferase n=1 Tax=Australozyma saopauloensis TaxID=291208 RepID=A0AAX4H7E1_9ASCO|nr:hypothetical protein PUMCH_001714 [[Candida] saopauloensis]